MRINRVEMTAFGPFKGHEEVDFDAFADDGIFLIAGRTGAGKTSILDAVCFGLYDSAPRYESSTEARYRSDHADADAEPRVTVTFTVGQARYRLSRTPAYERLKKRGAGVTTVKASADLARWSTTQGRWEGLASGAREVGTHVTEIVQLSKDQFLQVMLLAQNRFQEFLVADSKDRGKLLQTLFRTKRFEDYEIALEERRKALAGQLMASDETVVRNLAQLADRTGSDPFAGSTADAAAVRCWVSGLLDGEGERLAGLTAAAAEREAAAHRARAELDRVRTLGERQQRRARAQADLAAATARGEQVAAVVATLEAAHRAAVAWPVVVAEQGARAELERASTDLDEARSAYEQLVAAGARLVESLPSGGSSSGELTDTQHRLAALAGQLTGPARTEQDLPGLHLAARAAATAEQEHRAAHQASISARDALTARIEASSVRVEALRPTALDVGPAREALGAAEKVLADAVAATEASAQVRAATEELLARRAAHRRAEEHTDILWRRRLEQYAGTLAARLSPGTPCPVCGSTTHPAPAPEEPEPVTDELIDEATGAERSAREHVERAERAESDLRATLAALTAGGTNRSVEELRDELVRARARLDSATDAEREIARLTQERSRAVEEHGSASARIAELDAGAASVTEARVLAQNAVSTGQAAVDTARTGFETVAARVAALEEAIETTRLLVGARVTHEAATASCAQASRLLTLALAEHSFADAGAVTAARRAAEEVSALEAEVRTHGDALAAAQSTLAEPELQELPTEPVDLAPAREAAQEAEEALRIAAEVRGQASERRDNAARHAKEITTALDTTAQLRERFEVVEAVAGAVHGKNAKKMHLVDFVLAAELEQIVETANVRLAHMTDGRYELRHSDETGRGQSGLGLAVLDQHTGLPRSTQSLSGGEKFLASLALALGLAETVTNRAGGITMDTLFIDEGFGSLDSDTLEVAMATLDSLRAGGRTVGVISHVTSMQEQIPAQLLVETVAGGWSEIHR